MQPMKLLLLASVKKDLFDVEQGALLGVPFIFRDDPRVPAESTGMARGIQTSSSNAAWNWGRPWQQTFTRWMSKRCIAEGTTQWLQFEEQFFLIFCHRIEQKFLCSKCKVRITQHIQTPWSRRLFPGIYESYCRKRILLAWGTQGS